MRKNKLLPLAFLAAAGIGMFQSSAQAGTVSYSNGDLFLCFRATSGSNIDYVVNIGPASNYATATSSFIINLPGIGADLTQFYGDTWASTPELNWAVIGTTGSFSSAVGYPAKTLFASRAQTYASNVFTQSNPWTSTSDTSHAIATSKINAMIDAYKFTAGVPNASTANVPTGISQSGTPGHYSSFLSDIPANSFGRFTPTIEGALGGGVDVQGVVLARLDLYAIKPADGSTVMNGDDGDLLGTLAIYESGHVAFIPVGQALPPDIELTAPVLKLANTPKAGTKFTPASVGGNTQSFTGTIFEADSVPTLAYAINGGSSVAVDPADIIDNGSGNYSWSVAIPLVNGPNSIVFTATDESSNTASLTRLVSFLNPVTDPHELIGAPAGQTVANLTNGSISLPKGVINQGGAYTLTAKPAAGYIVEQWTKNNVPIDDASGNTLSITAENGDEYSATFVANFFPAVAGSYPGIFGTSNIATTSLSTYNLLNGGASFKLTGTGGFTGTVNIGGKTIPVKGTFNGLKQATVTVSGLALDLELDNTDPAHAFIEGTAIYNGGSSLAIKSYLAPTYTGKGTSISPLNGTRYSVSLQTETVDDAYGHGFASVAIDKTGVATVSGQLPDGTAFTAKVNAVDKGSGDWRIPVAVQLAKNKSGLLHGELKITVDGNATTRDVITDTGVAGFGWLRAAVAVPTAAFNAGILKNLGALGSQWILPANTSLLTGNNKIALFSFALDPDDAVALVAPSPTYFGYWPSTNLPGINGLPNGTTFKFTPSTGAFTGATTKSVVVGGKTKIISVPYRGLVLPDKVDIGPALPLNGVGYLIYGSLSGKVELGETVITAP